MLQQVLHSNNLFLSRLDKVLINFIFLLSFLFLFSSLSIANQGSPDSYGYVWTDSNAPSPTIAYSWDEISGTGTTIVGGCDDCGSTIPIGFTFNYYGTDYTDTFATSNGFLNFGGASSQFWNESLPSSSPTGKVAPFWDDLVLYGSGVKISYQTFGSAPNRYLVVQWNAAHISDNSNPLVFQVVLFEGSNNIEFRYNSMSGIYATGNSATIGLESSDGSIVNQYSYNTATVSNGMAIEFVASGGGGACVPSTGNLFNNPSFESGNFTGWVTQDFSSPFYTLGVVGAGISPGFGFFSSQPTDGIRAAIHGFDTTGPETLTIAQDVVLPNTASVLLTFDHRGAWNLSSFGAILDRVFTVEVEPSGGGAAMMSTTVLTATAGTLVTDTGNLSEVIDLTAFAGQSVRISFEWFVPEVFSGPAFVQLDNVFISDGSGGGCQAFAIDGDLIIDEDVGGGGTLTSSGGEGTLFYEVVDQPIYGTVNITSSLAGTYTYSPDADFEGSDFFTFNVLEGTNYSNTATVSITVNGTPDQPQLSSGPINTYINTPKSIQVYHNDPDVGDVHTYVISSMASDGSASIDSGGVATYTPNLDFTGLDYFDVLVTDIDSLQDYLTIAVMVTAIDTNPPVDGNLNITPSNSYAYLAWNSFIDDLGQITYTLVYDTTSTPSNCLSGTVLYSGMGTSFDHTNILNGTTYYYRLCATDTAGNVSPGVTGNALPYVSSNGITLTGDDTDNDGLERLDGGDDDHNLDESTGNPITNPGFNFKIVAKDSGSSSPHIALLFVSDRNSPTSYTAYNMTCTGNYTEGQLCNYTTILGPSAVSSYYFYVSLDGGSGSLVRYPTSGTITGPDIHLLNSYAVVGAARDIDSSDHDSTRGFGCMEAYRWISGGLSRVNSGNNGYFDLVTGVKPIKAGEAYFVKKSSCDGNNSLIELEGNSDITADTYEIPLKEGWNLISNPYNGDVLLNNIEVQKDMDTPVTWSEAVTDEWFVNGIYYYNGLDWGGTYGFESSGGISEAKLSPWTGYWLYLQKRYGDYKLIVPKP